MIAETHQVMCKWCDKPYVMPGPPKNIEGGYVSHGLCQPCYDRIKAEMKQHPFNPMLIERKAAA